MRVDDEFKEICAQIFAENKTSVEWSDAQSSDMYQTEHYCGGYDADESAFCFSQYDSDGKEWWFQISLKEVADIASGRLTKVEKREPN